MSRSSNARADYSPSSSNSVSGILQGIPDKILADWTGRKPNTIKDCRYGRSKWRADDLIAASAKCSDVRAKLLKLIIELENECQ